MSRVNYLLVGFMNVVVFCGAVGLLMPAESAARGNFKDKHFGIYKHKSELCTVLPPWSGVIPGEERFVPAFVDEDGVAHAYCDRQTGLVWEAAPLGPETQFTWEQAVEYCINLTVEGATGQKGWRLPYIYELASLVDTSSSTCTGVQGSICLPDGHPFTVMVSSAFFSASATGGGSGLNAWIMITDNGLVRKVGKNNTGPGWCVRGPMSDNGPF